MVRSAEDLKLDLVGGLVTVSDEARKVVLDAIAEEPDSENLALWLEVRGVQAGSFVYDLYFQALRDAGEDDVITASEELAIVIPATSAERLAGARLEYSDEGGGGLVLANPNVPTAQETAPGVPPEALEAGIETPEALRVRSVLDSLINPSIAAHGGRADLIAYDVAGGVAYLRLSGGCQGCAMSRMTLTQGIETALKEEVPEITSVVDVTDHAEGENPYY
ncbi:MAG: NifU family protein [Acidimicrobiales bacterium]